MDIGSSTCQIRQRPPKQGSHAEGQLNLSVGKNTRKSFNVIGFKHRRGGKLSQNSLGLPLDIYYFACDIGIAGLSFEEDFDEFMHTTHGLDEGSSSFGELLAISPKI